MTRVIGIVAGKGGVGKTTIAINLACALGLLKRKVCLIDFNLTTSHLALELGIMPPVTLNDVLRDERNIGRALYNYYDIHVLPASLSLSELTNLELSNLKFRIRNLLSDFEFVLLDSAPGFGREAILSIQTSDEEIFVANPTLTAITDLLKCKQLAMQLGVLPLGVIINKYKNKKFELKPEDVSGIVELPLLGVIKEDDYFLKSEAERTPLIYYKMNKARNFLKVASSLTGSEYKEPSLFKKWLTGFV